MDSSRSTVREGLTSSHGCSWAEQLTPLLQLLELIFQEDKSCPRILVKIEKIKINLNVREVLL